MAGFFARRLDRHTLSQEMINHLLLDIRKRRHLTDKKAVWEWLQTHPGIQTEWLQTLEQATQRRRINMQHLTSIIAKIRMELL